MGILAILQSRIIVYHHQNLLNRLETIEGLLHEKPKLMYTEYCVISFLGLYYMW
jgi:hypothetical protein